jgi:hypothetical protein
MYWGCSRTEYPGCMGRRMVDVEIEGDEVCLGIGIASCCLCGFGGWEIRMGDVLGVIDGSDVLILDFLDDVLLSAGLEVAGICLLCGWEVHFWCRLGWLLA